MNYANLKRFIVFSVAVALPFPLSGYFSQSFLSHTVFISAVFSCPDLAVSTVSSIKLSDKSYSDPLISDPVSDIPPADQTSVPDTTPPRSVPDKSEDLPGDAGENSSEEEISPASMPEETVPDASGIPTDRRGVIVKRHIQLSAGGYFISFGNNCLIKNLSSYSSSRILKELSTSNIPKIELNSNLPQALVYHTHATEAFSPYDNFFDTSYTFRSTDNNENMVHIGDIITETLNQHGINTLHSDTQHDYPLYKGAYTRSAVTIKDYLSSYSSLKILLDVHRDAMQSSDTSIIKPVVSVDGDDCAQIMIIVCSGYGKDDSVFDNLRFAADLQSKLESLYPGITRPILFADRKYNQELSPYALLIEMGSHANTLKEVERSALLLSNALCQLLRD